MAETSKDAEAAFDAFIAAYQLKYDKAVGCLARDRQVLLAFYDFPAEHWKHLPTSNPIESTFATVRHRTTRSDLATFLREIAPTPWGAAIRGGMAVLGVDGSQAQNGAGGPAAGHVRIKDGDTVAGNASGKLVALATTQAGYIEAKSRRQLVYSVMVNNVPFPSLEDSNAARADVADVVAAIQQGY